MLGKQMSQYAPIYASILPRICALHGPHCADSIIRHAGDPSPAVYKYGRNSDLNKKWTEVCCGESCLPCHDFSCGDVTKKRAGQAVADFQDQLPRRANTAYLLLPPYLQTADSAAPPACLSVVSAPCGLVGHHKSRCHKKDSSTRENNIAEKRYYALRCGSSSRP